MEDPGRHCAITNRSIPVRPKARGILLYPEMLHPDPIADLQLMNKYFNAYEADSMV